MVAQDHVSPRIPGKVVVYRPTDGDVIAGTALYGIAAAIGCVCGLDTNHYTGENSNFPTIT